MAAAGGGKEEDHMRGISHPQKSLKGETWLQKIDRQLINF